MLYDALGLFSLITEKKSNNSDMFSNKISFLKVIRK